jgi:hypothetical protein
MKPKVSDTLSPETLAQSDAAKAIALCRTGAVGEGIALYQKVLKRYHGATLPVGVHLKLLQSFGLHDAADIIRRSALASEDLCFSTAMGRSPAIIVDEYRSLFAEGAINARMASRFLVALSKLGIRDELAALLDPKRLFYMAQVMVGESAASHWKSLERVLLEAEVDDTWVEAAQSVRKMHYIKHLHRHPDRLLQVTLAEIHRQATHYVANWIESDHVISRWVPRTFRISAWAMISHGDGYNVPHIHNGSWITGILYVAGPDRADTGDRSPGALRVGPPPDVIESAGWPDITVAPAPGTLVLMPSYYTHWTVPLGRPGLRIAIAFDLVDLRDDPNQEAGLPPTM